MKSQNSTNILIIEEKYTLNRIFIIKAKKSQQFSTFFWKREQSWNNFIFSYHEQKKFFHGTAYNIYFLFWRHFTKLLFVFPLVGNTVTLPLVAQGGTAKLNFFWHVSNYLKWNTVPLGFEREEYLIFAKLLSLFFF